jgi:hypothetical protein
VQNRVTLVRSFSARKQLTIKVVSHLSNYRVGKQLCGEFGAALKLIFNDVTPRGAAQKVKGTLEVTDLVLCPWPSRAWPSKRAACDAACRHLGDPALGSRAECARGSLWVC